MRRHTRQGVTRLNRSLRGGAVMQADWPTRRLFLHITAKPVIVYLVMFTSRRHSVPNVLLFDRIPY